MSGSDQSKHTKAGLITGFICAALMAAVFIGWGLLESTKYQREADYQASEHAKYTSNIVAQTCVGIAPAKRFECVGNAIAAQRDTERNEEDLVAQKQSALWAYIMGAAAVIGMGLSALGVFLVWTTFHETRKANTIARNAMIGQLRPWIKITAQTDRQIGISRDEITLSVDLYFRNCGESPAINFCYSSTFYRCDISRDDLAKEIRGWFNEESNSYDEVNIFQNDLEHRNCQVVITNPCPDEIAVNLVIAARYQSAFSPDHHYTAIVLRVVKVANSSHIYAVPPPNHTEYHGVTLSPRENFAGIAT